MWGDALADHAADYHQDRMRRVLQLGGWSEYAIERLRSTMEKYGCTWGEQ